MNCPRCASENTETVETRKVSGGMVDRRRHHCLRCEGRWTSRTEIDAGSISGPPWDATGSVAAPAGSITTGSVDATGSVGQKSPNPPPNTTGSAPHATRSGGGVGGGLSSDSGSGSDSDLHTPQTRAWDSNTWYRRFGNAWAEKKGRLAYGRGGIADSQATGSLTDILSSLGAEEAMRAQVAAPAMFAAFLALDDQKLVQAQHPWSWFVSRFNGILVSVLPSADEIASRRAAKKADNGPDWWNDPERMKGPPPDFVAERERRRALAAASAASEGFAGQRTGIVEPSAS